MNQSATIEELYCSLLYLLSRQSRSPEIHLTSAINEHLQWLAGHPDTNNLPILRKTCRRLALYWQEDEKSNGQARDASRQCH